LSNDLATITNITLELATEDYEKAFVFVEKLKTLILHNAYQFKDSVMDFMVEKATHLTDLRLYAANLVSSEKWTELFRARGFNLKTLKLRWLDAAFEDKQVADLVKFCPNLTRLKLEHIWRIGPDSFKSLAKLKHLEHLSLQYHASISADVLVKLIQTLGPKLQTLSLRDFTNLNDDVLNAIHTKCTNLTKLRIINTDQVTDHGMCSLFTKWKNFPLQKVDLSCTRDLDNQKPDGPEDEAIGLGSDGFQALMAHSGSNIQHLDISSCRHISLTALLEVFTSETADYPCLQTLNMNFVRDVDEVVLTGVFRAAKDSLKRVEMFGCFSVKEGVIVPAGVVVIGAPRLEIEEGGMEVYGMAASERGGQEEMVRRMEVKLDAMVVD
jgi:DNA repair protein RAD7